VLTPIAGTKLTSANSAAKFMPAWLAPAHTRPMSCEGSGPRRQSSSWKNSPLKFDTPVDQSSCMIDTYSLA
jgi:hypothetical protein